jgi:hypothetical protein
VGFRRARTKELRQIVAISEFSNHGFVKTITIRPNFGQVHAKLGGDMEIVA